MGMGNFDELVYRIRSLNESGREDDAYQLLMDEFNSGNNDARTALGIYYVAGIYVARDPELGVQLLEEAGQKGSLDAYYWLYNTYVDKENDVIDFDSACNYLQMAADAGHLASLSTLATNYFHGMNGYESNQRLAFEYGQKAAKLGDAQGAYIIATEYAYGDIGVNDVEQAIYWYREAYQRDPKTNIYACYALGTLLADPFNEFNINPTQEMLEEAFYWTSKGVEGGNLDCHVLIGIMYCDGIGVNQDVDMAHKYIEIAANNGSEDGLRLLKRFRKTIFGRYVFS